PCAANGRAGGLRAAAAKVMEYAREAGFPARRVKCSYFVALADTPEQQLRAKERLVYYQRGVGGAAPVDPGKTPASYAYFQDIINRGKSTPAAAISEVSI